MATKPALPNLFKRLAPYALAAVTSIMPPTATRASRERAADVVAGAIENIINNAAQDAATAMATTAAADDIARQAMLEQALSSMTTLGTNDSAVNTLSSPEVPEKAATPNVANENQADSQTSTSSTASPQSQSQSQSQSKSTPQSGSPVSRRAPSQPMSNISPDTTSPSQSTPQSQSQSQSESPQNAPMQAVTPTESPMQTAATPTAIPNADFGKTEPTASPAPAGQGMSAEDMAPSTTLEDADDAPENNMFDYKKASKKDDWNENTEPKKEINEKDYSTKSANAPSTEIPDTGPINRADAPAATSETPPPTEEEQPGTPAAPFQSMPLQSSDSNQGDITAPDTPMAATTSTETGEQPNGQEEGGGQQPQQKTRSGFMQGLNKLRFWKDIRAIDKEIKDLSKQKKPAEKQLKNDIKKIRPLQIALSGFKLAKVLAYIAESLLYFIGGLFAITIIGIEISLVLWGLAPEVHAFASSMKAAAKRTQKAMEPIMKKVQKDKAILTNIGKRIQALAGRRRTLENASLRDQQEQQQTAGTPPQP